MPKSKREKSVALTKTKKHGRVQKEQLITNIRQSVEMYERIFLFEVENYRNTSFKNLREQWGGSRFFYGNRGVMQVALGRGPETEVRENLSKLSSELSGDCGLLFTDSPAKAVMDYFQSFSEDHFARSGFPCEESFDIPAGPLPTEEFPHPLEPQLRKLGLPTRLNKGVIELSQETTVCQPGDLLTPEQCRILELWGQKMAKFRIHLLGHYEDGKYVKLAESKRNSVIELNLDDEDDMDGEDPNEFKEEFLPVPDLSTPEATAKSMELFFGANANAKQNQKAKLSVAEEKKPKTSGQQAGLASQKKDNKSKAKSKAQQQDEEEFPMSDEEEKTVSKGRKGGNAAGKPSAKSGNRSRSASKNRK